MACGLSTDIFWDVSNCDIYRVCLLVTEKSELSLVRGHNHWDNCCSRLTCLEAFLKMAISIEFHIITNYVPEQSTTSCPCTFRYRCGKCARDLYSGVRVQIRDLERTGDPHRVIGYTL